mmetsp:Transcript_19467/g.44271  ORF Transcript_19467/g.44271 Transcript_19467/m.44271 type:complete len:261 (-) Transcript_19467:117-899(-)
MGDAAEAPAEAPAEAAEVPFEARVCRFCLDDALKHDDEFLAPCRCSGSMKWVHRSCLDHWRMEGLIPRTVTHCGTCHERFWLEDQGAGARSPLLEVWLRILRYVSVRAGAFLAAVVILGFVPPLLLGYTDTRLLSSSVMNHLTLGTVSTCALAGGAFIIKILMYVNFGNLAFDRLSFGKDFKDMGVILLIILIILGACVLIYYLIEGIMEIASVGRHVAASNLRHVNRQMRFDIVKRHRVVSLEARPPWGERGRRASGKP